MVSPRVHLAVDAARSAGARALHLLTRRTGFFAATSLCLALGIATASAMFGVVDTLFVRRPPGVHVSGTLFRLFVHGQSIDRVPLPPGKLSLPLADALRKRAAVFSRTTIIATQPLSVGRSASRHVASAAFVTASYFSVLGAHPDRGRFFTSHNDHSAADLADVVLSHAWWIHEEGGDPRIVGSTVIINGVPARVVAVSEPQFRGLEHARVDLWLPLQSTRRFLAASPRPSAYGNTRFTFLAELRSGATVEQAEAQATDIIRAAVADVPDFGRNVRARLAPAVVPLGMTETPSGTVDNQHTGVVVWLGAIAVAVLLIAWSNAINLILIHTTRRRSETAVRIALGASRGHLLRQFMGEGALVAGLSLAGGYLLTSYAGAVLRLIPGLPSDVTVRTWHSFLFASVIALVAGVLLGIVPVWASAGARARHIMGGQSRGTSGRTRLPSYLLTAQIALTSALLVTAGLFIQSFRRAAAAAPPFDVDSLITVHPGMAAASLDRQEFAAFARTLRGRLNASSGISATAMGLVTPFYSSQGWRIGVDGDNPTTGPTVMMDAVDSAYFHVVGTGVMRGRGFDPSDYQTGDAMLVNERFARRFFGTTDALGRCVRLALSTRPCIHVVGVVRNSKYMSLRESPQPFFYLPLTARWEWTPLRAIYARTTHDATATAAELRRTLPMVSPYAVDISVQSFREILRDQLAPARLRMTICVVFAGVALIIAMIGTYAVVAYSIERRMREVGVRLALGASPRDIRHLIVEFALRHAIVGLLLGLTVGFLVNTLLAHFLYAVAPSDIEAFGGAMGVVVVGSIVASIIPAWRASRADPVAILRSE